MLRLSITCGDINGIGPEVALKTINKIYKPGKRKILFFCPANIFESTASLVKPVFDFQITKSLNSVDINEDKVLILDNGNIKQAIGRSTKEAGQAAFKSINSAFSSIVNNYSDAIITAPSSKTSFQLAGINYPGQTEIFADLCNSKNYMMVFLSFKMICGLQTIHEPVKNVSKNITKPGIKKSLLILDKTLKIDIAVKSPRIAVLGLNPHAGENGNIGKEELNIISPAIENLKSKINVEGPFVPDAFFATQQFKYFDAILGMYHDQLLIPFKMMNFNRGVNFTAGLQVIRTSPDHGTAYDIAGNGTADPGSMIEAVRWAEKIVLNRKKYER